MKVQVLREIQMKDKPMVLMYDYKGDEPWETSIKQTQQQFGNGYVAIQWNKP